MVGDISDGRRKWGLTHDEWFYCSNKRIILYFLLAENCSSANLHESLGANLYDLSERATVQFNTVYSFVSDGPWFDFVLFWSCDINKVGSNDSLD